MMFCWVRVVGKVRGKVRVKVQVKVWVRLGFNPGSFLGFNLFNVELKIGLS
jgi:hypothetical protein